MNILVAGGTGFIGKKIVKSLANEGYKVFVLTRDIINHQNTFTKDIQLIDWSSKNPSKLKEISVLIKLNGEKVDQLWTKSAKDKIINSRIATSKMLFDFCVNNEIVPEKLINASAVGIYALNSAQYNSSVDENSQKGDTFLSKVCIENEQSTKFFNVFENIEIIQLRIGVVLRKKIISLLSINLFLSIPIPGNKSSYFPWVHVDDIVGFIHHSINNSIEGVFNLVGPELTSHKIFFKTILKNKKRVISWVIFLPNFLTKLIFGDMSEMLLFGPKTKPNRTLESGYKFKYTTLSDALSNLSE